MFQVIQVMFVVQAFLKSILLKKLLYFGKK